MGEEIWVEDYGAVGDGVTSDAAAIQLAIDKGIEVNKSVRFRARTYLVDVELVITNFAVLKGAPRSGLTEIAGPGSGLTTLKAEGNIRSLIAISGNRSVLLSDISLNGNRACDYCLLLQGASNSTFERLGVTKALADGVHLAALDDDGVPTINDRNTWSDLRASNNGTLYLTSDLLSAFNAYGLSTQLSEQPGASAATSTGSNVVSFVGIDLAAVGVRPGDPVALGSGPATIHTMVVSVGGATTLTVAEAMADTASGLSFAFGRGDGYHEVRHGDNNLGSFYGGLFRSNAGYAMAFDGLYGPTVIGHQIDYHPFWGIRIGTNGSGPVIGCRIIGPYFETIGVKPFLLRGSNNIGIYHPMDNAYQNDPVDYLGNAANNVSGMYINAEGMKPISYLMNELPSNNLVNATVSKNFYLRSAIMQPVNETGTNDPVTAFPIMRPGTSTLTLTGTPTFATTGREGKVMCLLNEGPATVVLQDDSVLAGSKLRLTSSAYSMGAGDSVLMVCTGAEWFEVSRSQTI